MDDLNILTECYIDTNLLETLVPPKRGYNHQKGCNTVVNIMKKQLEGHPAIALIDKDKREMSYIKEFKGICHSDSLNLLKHKTRSHYIILVAPATDAFIIKSANDSGINLIDFDLPDTINELTKLAKQKTSKTDPCFKKLFKKMKGAYEMQILRKWIEYLKDNIYNADEVILKKIADGNEEERKASGNI